MITGECYVKGRLQDDIVDMKWPPPNEYTAQLKFKIRLALAGSSWFNDAWDVADATESNVPNLTGTLARWDKPWQL